MSGSMQMTAIARGRTDLVVRLLETGAAGEPAQLADALRWAAYYGDCTACRILHRHGLPLDLLGDDRGLGAAAFHGHWQLCEWLLECGADARRADPLTGETALHAALVNEDRERYDRVLQVLLAAGADPNAATMAGQPTAAFMRDSRTRGERPLHRAALFGTAATIRLLLGAGAEPAALDAGGESALAWASWARRPVEVLRLLLFGEHRIHPDHQPLRVSLLGSPRTGDAQD